MKNYLTTKILLVLLFLFALSLRLYGLNWDQGTHLHPDERFLTMVTNDIRLPTSLPQYFDNSQSPLNPYNYPQYQFFVYGTLPVFLTKAITVLIGFDNYDKVHLVGRSLSAFFDSSNIFLLYLISLKIFKQKSKLILLPSLLYAFCILPIQLSHFYAVDTFLTTFLLSTFTFITYSRFRLAGVAFGLALACKISAIYFSPIIGLFFIIFLIKSKNIFRFLLCTFYFVLFTFIFFRIFQPYIFDGIFKINLHFIDNIKQLQSMTRPDGNFPPSIQWFSKIPLLFSLQNIILWGVGIPLTLITILGIFKLNLKKTNYLILISILWTLILYFYQGSQFAHTMRYLLIIYPFVCLVASYLGGLLNSVKLLNFLVICHLILGFLFLSIYTRPHSRVQASAWIYDHLPPGSKITNEYWDDPLPLYLQGNDPNIYNDTMLPLYDPDSPEKWDKLNQVIDATDYIIMSSNRLWGSIPLVPDKFPQTSKFYQELFSQNLGFTKLVEINSYPGVRLPINSCYYFGPSNFPGVKNSWFSIDTQCLYPGIYIRDDIAEEAFSVYDHPKVLIFSRTDH
ncbi:hypothetical protein HYV64_01475 [Candidatus Shapirobacteria bacterium]|nr:hypothetical protein [Candidatus Shapirobacteria bacterium]